MVRTQGSEWRSRRRPEPAAPPPAPCPLGASPYLTVRHAPASEFVALCKETHPSTASAPQAADIAARRPPGHIAPPPSASASTVQKPSCFPSASRALHCYERPSMASGPHQGPPRSALHNSMNSMPVLNRNADSRDVPPHPCARAPPLRCARHFHSAAPARHRCLAESGLGSGTSTAAAAHDTAVAALTQPAPSGVGHAYDRLTPRHRLLEPAEWCGCRVEQS